MRPQSYTASAQLLSVSLLDCSSDTLYPELLSVVPTSSWNGARGQVPIMSLELRQHRADTEGAKEGGGEEGQLTVNLQRLRFIMHHCLLETVTTCSPHAHIHRMYITRHTSHSTHHTAHITHHSHTQTHTHTHTHTHTRLHAHNVLPITALPWRSFSRSSTLHTLHITSHITSLRTPPPHV